jgi:hypothetical protein
MSDWRDPFLEFQVTLQHIYEENLSVYHTVALSPSTERANLSRSLEFLEPAFHGKQLVLEIPVNTPGCSYHGHLFFADERNAINQIQRALSGIESWCDQFPPRMFPSFDIPRVSNQGHRDLIRWTSIVYYLAMETRAPYLEAEIEFQKDVNVVGFFPWNECPQPSNCNPLAWLVHLGIADNRIETARQDFREHDETIPDLIDVYLYEDYVKSSIAAIDIMAYKLHSERRHHERSEKRKPKRRRYKVSEMKSARMAMILRAVHENEVRILNSNGTVRHYLTWDEVAQKASILTNDKKPASSTVSRLADIIFGDDASTTYRRLAEASDRGRKLKAILDAAVDRYAGIYDD